MYSGYQSLIRYMIWKYFLPFCGPSFHFLDCAIKFDFFKSFNKLFIYFWLCWVFIAAHGLSLIAVSKGYSSLWCVGFSLQWLLVAEHGL